MMSLVTQQGFSSRLLRWWTRNKRQFPWRAERDAYLILVAEVLLHRTRAMQVEPIYNRFVARFPNIFSLAAASEEDVAEILKPLGLRWRADLLLQMAKEIVSKYDGNIPRDKAQLESLPGIGPYISSAVRCFGFGQVDAILDTNTVRILGRVFGSRVTDGSRRSKKFKQMYESILDKNRSREFNFAMIDLAAVVCIPVNPRCNECPVRELCRFGSSGGAA